MKKRIVIAVCLYLILLVPCILHAAQKVEKGKTGGPQYGGILRIIQPVGPKLPFGWPIEGAGESTVPNKPILESLIYCEYGGGACKPWLAESFKVAPDKSSITFHLKKGVKFHDGTDLNAEAVKFNLDARRDAKMPGTREWTSIDIVDPYTLRINVSGYTNLLIRYLSGTRGALVSPSSYKKHGLDFIRWNPIGTGPFEFVSFERDVSVKTKRFNGYWDKGKPYLDGIEYLFISDPMTQRAAMEAKEGDVLLAKNMKIASELRDMGFKTVSRATGTVVLIPDSANPSSPLSDKRVREAIEYAIDREAIVKAKGYGFLEAQYQLPLKGTLGYVKDLKGRRYSPEKAKALLKEAGYEKGLKLTIIPHTALVDRDVVVIIQDQLRKVGMDVDVDFVDPGRHEEYRRKGWKNALLCSGMPMINYLFTVDLYFGPRTKDFPSMWKPERLYRMLDEALSTITPERERVERLTKVLFEDAVVVPVITRADVVVMRKNVEGGDFLKFDSPIDWSPANAYFAK